ncbi:MAG: glutamine--tRNA ligase/YqeY domain fusion protein [Deltaproteobacteria bacterium]|nr:MAG: glutamine--tRNA ligase/YqeY domain fusion protein [Deltaproteobacteria bacterium]
MKENLPKGENEAPNFIQEIIERDLAEKDGTIHTRFPPEPNGYLHIGHAKSICINFGLAERFGGKCNLRFDDTNPVTEEEEFVAAIQEDIRWLGFDWEDRLYFASDYYEQLYEWAVALIKAGKAYVDSQSEAEIKENRGNYYKPGVESPYRNRSVEENLDLFERMRKGEFPDGAHVLRARIDMQHPNMNMRDPLMYRIKHARHHRTGDAWCIYPMYDWAHGQSDAIEGITHSICTLEFENHRPLYDWFLEALGIDPRPRQIEFAPLQVSYMITSKRKLRELVEKGFVSGWDDPRMPTLRGMRRRGIPPAAIRNFCDRIGVSKREGLVDISLLEYEIREELNRTAPRVMGVLHPLKVVITNFPEDATEMFEALYFPDEPEKGTRKVPFCREIYVEREDFREDPPRKWHRLAPGREVRLRYACLVTCNEVIRNEAGEVVELRCTWDPGSRGGNAPDGRKVRGTLHWVSARHALPAEVRLYDRLFTRENPLDHPEGGDFKDFLNPDSLEIVDHALVEPSLASAKPGEIFQFERLGYFCVDPVDSGKTLVFNRTITLRDSWARIERAMRRKEEG